MTVGGSCCVCVVCVVIITIIYTRPLPFLTGTLHSLSLVLSPTWLNFFGAQTNKNVLSQLLAFSSNKIAIRLFSTQNPTTGKMSWKKKGNTVYQNLFRIRQGGTSNTSFITQAPFLCVLRRGNRFGMSWMIRRRKKKRYNFSRYHYHSILIGSRKENKKHYNPYNFLSTPKITRIIIIISNLH